MTEDERQSIILQLALAEGVNVSVFEKHNDEKLESILKEMYGVDSDVETRTRLRVNQPHF